MSMTKPETESGRQMHREKFSIFTMRRTSLLQKKALSLWLSGRY